LAYDVAGSVVRLYASLTCAASILIRCGTLPQIFKLNQVGATSMDFLKNISFSIALFFIGAIFLFLGLSGGFTVSNYSFTIQDALPRVVSSIIGGILIAVAIYLEVKVRPASEKLSGETPATKESVTSLSKAKGLRAEEFFYTLDDRPAEGFANMVKDAVRVQILGRTAVNLLSQYERVFEELGRAGCEIQLLFVDPSSEASKFLYGSNPEVYGNNIILASQHLKRLKSIMGYRLQVRVTKHAPTSSIIVIEKQDMPQGFIQVNLYFLHSAVGRDRPIFKVNHGDKWYSIFRDEFTQLWTDSVEWDISLFLETASKSRS
jgi:hypothetical protein